MFTNWWRDIWSEKLRWKNGSI